MKCSLGVSNFLEEIASLSHSIIFLYIFALITEEPLQIAEKRREAKGKGKKGKIYPSECKVPKNSKET